MLARGCASPHPHSPPTTPPLLPALPPSLPQPPTCCSVGTPALMPAPPPPPLHSQQRMALHPTPQLTPQSSPISTPSMAAGNCHIREGNCHIREGNCHIREGPISTPSMAAEQRSLPARVGGSSPPSQLRRRLLQELEGQLGRAKAPSVAPRARSSVLGAIAHMLRSAPRRHVRLLKRHMVECGGMAILMLNLIEPQREDSQLQQHQQRQGTPVGDHSGGAGAATGWEFARVAQCAVGAVCELLSGSEDAKVALRKVIGVAPLLQHLLKAHCFDRLSMHFLFELSCTSSFRRVLGLMPHSYHLFERSPQAHHLTGHSSKLLSRSGQWTRHTAASSLAQRPVALHSGQ